MLFAIFQVRMLRHSKLYDALKSMYNADNCGKRQVSDQALFQGHHQVPYRHAEVLLVPTCIFGFVAALGESVPDWVLVYIGYIG